MTRPSSPLVRVMAAAMWLWLLCLALVVVASVLGQDAVVARVVGIGSASWPPFDGDGAALGNLAAAAAAAIVVGGIVWRSYLGRRVPRAVAGLGAVAFLLAATGVFARAAADPLEFNGDASGPSVDREAGGLRLDFFLQNRGPSRVRIVGLRPADPSAPVRVLGSFEAERPAYFVGEARPLGHAIDPARSTPVHAALYDPRCARRTDAADVAVLVDFVGGGRRGTSHVVVPVPPCGG